MRFFDDNDSDIYSNYNKVQKKKDTKSLVIILGIAVLIMVILLISVTAGNKTPPQKIDTSNLETQAPVKEEEIITSQFTLEKYETDTYSLDVPSEWVEVNKDGFSTFIHQPTSASIQIRKMSYSPVLNMVSAELFKSNLANLNQELLSFSRTSPSSYELTYINAKTFFAEFTFYDRADAYTLYCTAPIEQKDSFLSTFILSAQSFAFEQTSPIVEGYSIFYSDNLHYEIAYPINWSVGYENDVFTAVNIETGTTMVVTASATKDEDLSSINQNMYNSIINQNRQNYQMLSFENDGQKLSSQGVFINSNNEKVRIIQSMIMGKGGYYIITYECKEELAVEESKVYDTITEMFRIL